MDTYKISLNHTCRVADETINAYALPKGLLRTAPSEIPSTVRFASFIKPIFEHTAPYKIGDSCSSSGHGVERYILSEFQRAVLSSRPDTIAPVCCYTRIRINGTDTPDLFAELSKENMKEGAPIWKWAKSVPPLDVTPYARRDGEWMCVPAFRDVDRNKQAFGHDPVFLIAVDVIDQESRALCREEHFSIPIIAGYLAKERREVGRYVLLEKPAPCATAIAQQEQPAARKRETTIYRELDYLSLELKDLKSYIVLDLGISLDDARKIGVLGSYLYSKYGHVLDLLRKEDIMWDIAAGAANYLTHRKNVPDGCNTLDLQLQLVSRFFECYDGILPEFDMDDAGYWDTRGSLMADREPEPFSFRKEEYTNTPKRVDFQGTVEEKYPEIIRFLTRSQHAAVSVDDIINGD